VALTRKGGVGKNNGKRSTAAAPTNWAKRDKRHQRDALKLITKITLLKKGSTRTNYQNYYSEPNPQSDQQDFQ